MVSAVIILLLRPSKLTQMRYYISSFVESSPLFEGVIEVPYLKEFLISHKLLHFNGMILLGDIFHLEHSDYDIILMS